MANKVIQYRYYGDKDPRNFPIDSTSENYVSGEVFAETMPILQLGIQTIPGAKFKLNTGDSIIIGSTGIYELDLNNKTEITSLSFEASTLNFINNLKAYLIVDVVYESL